MSSYFKRDDVIEAMMSTSITNNAVILCNIGAAILKIPASDVRENVHAHWVKLDMHKGMEQYKCSACAENCYVPECMGEPMYAYCPNCGAIMDEEAEP